MSSGYGQLVIGPAGSGKTTYCKFMQQRAIDKKREIRIVNLDPAAEPVGDYDIDIRELINIDDVMQELGYGPNGGLVYCMEYLLENTDWLQEQIQGFREGDYFLFDCPGMCDKVMASSTVGQIELYSHLDTMKRIADAIKSCNITLCGIYCMDITFLNDCQKYISGSLVYSPVITISYRSLSSMIQLELPYITVLTKCDKFPNAESKVDEYAAPLATNILIDSWK